MTIKEAERIIRQVIASHLGEPMAANLFKDSVDQLLAEVNQDEHQAQRKRNLDTAEMNERRALGIQSFTPIEVTV